MLMSRQFLLFLVTGGIAALVNVGSRICYNYWLSFSTSIVLAYLTGMITAFVLAKQFVFSNSQQPLHRSAAWFVMVNGVAILQTWVISMSFAYYVLPFFRVVLFAKEIAHLIGVMVPVASSYVGHKRFSFRESEAS
jgi:putative flippase GtrA